MRDEGGNGMADVVEVRSDSCVRMPIYLQIRKKIHERIVSGEYPVGGKIPSEGELASEFSTTRLTVRSAVDSLVDCGLVRRAQGKGMFVAAAEELDVRSKHTGFRQMAEESDGRPSVRVLSKSKRYAGPYYAEIFGIEPQDVLLCVRRLNSIDDKPVAIEKALIPLRFFEGIENIDISVFSLYETYAMYGHEVALVQEKLDIEMLSARDAGLLQREPGELVLMLECVSYDADKRPIEYAVSLNCGERRTYTYRY